MVATIIDSVVGFDDTQHDYGCDGIFVDAAGVIHVVYANMQGGGGNSHIFYTKSLDNGITWTPPTQLDFDNYGNYGQAYPRIAGLPNGNMLVTWSGKSLASPGIFQIRYCKYTSGVGWGSALDVTAAITNLQATLRERQLIPNIAGTKYDLVYWGYREDIGGAGTTPKCRTFTDATDTWTTWDVLFPHSVNDQYMPSTSRDSVDDLHTVWDGQPPSYGPNIVYYNKRTSGVWGLRSELSDNLALAHYCASIVAITPSDLHACWTEMTTPSRVQYRHYNGAVWEAVEQVSVNTELWSTITRDSLGNIYVLFMGNDGGINQIKVRKRSPAGAWDFVKVLTTGTAKRNPVAHYQNPDLWGRGQSDNGFKMLYNVDGLQLHFYSEEEEVGGEAYHACMKRSLRMPLEAR
jgi:hypothetical protein